MLSTAVVSKAATQFLNAAANSVSVCTLPPEVCYVWDTEHHNNYTGIDL